MENELGKHVKCDISISSKSDKPVGNGKRLGRRFIVFTSERHYSFFLSKNIIKNGKRTIKQRVEKSEDPTLTETVHREKYTEFESKFCSVVVAVCV